MRAAVFAVVPVAGILAVTLQATRVGASTPAASTSHVHRERRVASGDARAGKVTGNTPSAEELAAHLKASGLHTPPQSGSTLREPHVHPYATSDGLSFTVSNEYPALKNSAWTHVAEPFRTATFRASSAFGNPKEDVFQWSFQDGTVLEGREVDKTFETLGKHAVSVRQIIVSTGNVYRLDSTVMVKYVRREIRQLNEPDREAFFDALETLYRLPTAEGNARYGDDYKGIDYFVQMHLDGAGVKECDHWHDDAGIMTHHVGYTLQFEQALQLVDPSVSIPYWEYTIEAASGLTHYGLSEIFQPDWFGIASPQNPMHTVDSGRWAYLPVMKNAWEYVHNSYGLLRSPWNLDGTPYVTRFNVTNGESLTDVVSCSAYQTCFDENTLGGLNHCLNGGTHGPVHIKLGGEWNDPEEALTIDLVYSASVPLIAKYLWRKGYLRIPSTCTVEENGLGNESTCRSSCPADIYESRGMKPYDVLMDVHGIYWIAGGFDAIVYYDKDEERFVIAGHENDERFSDKLWLRILDSFCDVGHVGELFTSSAPYDPLFWVIHPTADRFLAWRRKLATEHPVKFALDETWGYETAETVGETGYVCDWEGVRENTLELPTCIKQTCGGHNADDMLPFKVKVNGEKVEMTNMEWYNFIYPDNDDLPYMYNEFEWEHCAAEGVYMGTKH